MIYLVVMTVAREAFRTRRTMMSEPAGVTEVSVAKRFDGPAVMAYCSI